MLPCKLRRAGPVLAGILICIVVMGCPEPASSGSGGDEQVKGPEEKYPSFNMGDMSGMDLSSNPNGQNTEAPSLTALQALRDTIKKFKGWNSATGKWDRDQHDPFPHLCRVLPDGSTRYIMHNSSVVHIWRQYTAVNYYNDTEIQPNLHEADPDLWVNTTNDTTVSGNAALPAYPWYEIPGGRYSGTLCNWTTEISTGEDIAWSYRANRLMGGASESDRLRALKKATGYADYEKDCWLGTYDVKAKIRQKFSYDAYLGGQNGHFTRTVFSLRHLSPPGNTTTYSTIDDYNLDWSKPMVFNGVIPVYVYLTYIKYLHGRNHWNSFDTPPDSWTGLTGYKRLSDQSLDTIDEILDLIEGKNNYGPDLLSPYDRYSQEAGARHAQYGIRDCSVFEIYDELYFGKPDTAIENIDLSL
jgi:hypothetical protein